MSLLLRADSASESEAVYSSLFLTLFLCVCSASIRFDIMVNGGGAVNLQFQRAPFRPMTRPVAVAWNQLVVLEPIVMLLDSERPVAGGQRSPPACRRHQPDQLRPVIVNTWQPDTVIDGDQTADIDGAAVLVETQVSPAPGRSAAVCSSLQSAVFGSCYWFVHVIFALETQNPEIFLS